MTIKLNAAASLFMVAACTSTTVSPPVDAGPFYVFDEWEPAFPHGTPWYEPLYASSNGDLLPPGIQAGFRQIGPTDSGLDAGPPFPAMVDYAADGLSFRLRHAQLPEGLYQADFRFPFDAGAAAPYPRTIPVAARGMYRWSQLRPTPARVGNEPPTWTVFGTSGCVAWGGPDAVKLACLMSDLIAPRTQAMDINLTAGRQDLTWQRHFGPAVPEGVPIADAVVEDVDGEPTYFATGIGYPHFFMPFSWQPPVWWRRLSSPDMELGIVGRGEGPSCGMAFVRHLGGPMILLSSLLPAPGQLRAFSWSAADSRWDPVPTVSPGKTYCGMRGVDFDSDGDYEIVATELGMAGVVVLRLEGEGTLQLTEVATTARGPVNDDGATDMFAARQVRPFVGDLDGDLRPDVLIKQDGTLEAWFNDSTGGTLDFAVRQWTNVGGGPGTAGFFSLDEGGIVITSATPGVIAGRDSGFTPQPFRWQNIEFAEAFPPGVADLDGDGQLDLYFLNHSAMHLWRVPTQATVQEVFRYLESDGGVLEEDWEDPDSRRP